MALSNAQSASNAVSIQQQPPTATLPTLCQAELADPEAFKIKIGEDAWFLDGEVKLAQQSAAQHLASQTGDIQIALPPLSGTLAGWSAPLSTERVALKGLRQPITAPATEKYSFAVFVWNGEGKPSAKLADAVHTKLRLKALNRTPIEKRVWMRKKPDVEEPNADRWRWVSMRMFHASDFSTQHLSSWEAGVQSHLRAENAVPSRNSYQLLRIEVDVRLIPPPSQSAGAAGKPSPVDHDYSLTCQDLQIMSQAALTSQLPKRSNAALVGNHVFDMGSPSTIVDKGLALCFGKRLTPGTGADHVGKLFFAPGSVADFIIARFGEARFLGVDGPSEKLMGEVRDCLRGLNIAVLDDVGRQRSHVVVANDANAGIALMLPAMGNGGSPLLHPKLPYFNVGTKSRPQWHAAERCIIAPLQPYTSSRPNKVDLQQQMMLLGRALGKIRLDLPAPVEPSNTAVAMRDLQFKPVPVNSSAQVGGSPSTTVAKRPTYVVLRVTSDLSGEMKWPSIVFATLAQNVSEKAGLLTLTADQVIDDSSNWQYTLGGFIAGHKARLADRDQLALVICLPAVLSEKSSKSGAYTALKAFCDIELGIHSFVINESTLAGAKHDFLTGLDARVKRAANQIPMRFERRQHHVDAPGATMSKLDQPLDLAVGVHFTLVKSSKTDHFTHVLLTVASRALHASASYSTRVELYAVRDTVMLWQELDDYLVSLIPEQADHSKQHKLTVFRSGALLGHTAAEVNSIVTRFALAGKSVEFKLIRVSKDSEFTGQILASEQSAAHNRALATGAAAQPEGFFYLRPMSAPADVWLPAVYVSQAQSAPYLSFLKLLIAGGTMESGSKDPSTKPTPGVHLPGPESSCKLPEDYVDRLAPVFRDDALGLLPTCKWPVPTHLARCAADRALLHLKASNPGVEICVSAKATVDVKVAMAIEDEKQLIAKQHMVPGTAVVKTANTATMKPSSETADDPRLIFRPVHANLQDTLYYF